MNIVLLIALMTVLGATLTMPGIAGLVLSIGMAVDANVLIFERIREELKTARGPARAIELGFEKAQSPILDGNLTTLIVAGILYAMGAGPVRGFGITLALGLLCSMFTAISLSRLLISLLVRLAAAQDGHDLRHPMRRLRLVPDDTNFDFFRPMRFWLAVSLLGVHRHARHPADPRAELRRRLPRRHADPRRVPADPRHRRVPRAAERARPRRRGGDRGLGRLRRAGGADAPRHHRRRGRRPDRRGAAGAGGARTPPSPARSTCRSTASAARSRASWCRPASSPCCSRCSRSWSTSGCASSGSSASARWCRCCTT